MTVSKTSEEDIRISLSGEGERRMIPSSELRYGKDAKIWLGMISGPAIWHQHDIAREQAGQVVPLDWRIPFAAQWRVDWRREEHVTDSWDMINERPDGSFTKHSVYGGLDTIPPNRQRWTTVLGTFNYPCWVDIGGNQDELAPCPSRRSEALTVHSSKSGTHPQTEARKCHH